MLREDIVDQHYAMTMKLFYTDHAMQRQNATMQGCEC